MNNNKFEGLHPSNSKYAIDTLGGKFKMKFTVSPNRIYTVTQIEQGEYCEWVHVDAPFGEITTFYKADFETEFYRI